MKLTVLRRDLFPALTAVKHVVEGRTTIPILANVVLDAAPGKLTLRATDLDIEIRTTIAAEVETASAITVSATRLRDIVAKLPDGMISITASAGALSSKVEIRAGRAKFDLQALPVSDFPDLAIGLMTHHWEMVGDLLAAAFEATAFAISSEETRYYLNGTYMAHVGEQIVFVATDGHRLSLVARDLPDGAAAMPGVIVPRKTVGEIIALCGGAPTVARVSLSEAKISIAVGDTEIASKLIDGTFPDYARVIPRGHASAVEIDRDDLAAACDRVLTVASERGRAVKLVVLPESSEIRLEVADPDSGSASETLVTGDGSGDEITLGLNGRYLSAALQALPGTAVRLAYGDAGSPVLLTPTDDPTGERRLIVVMPMRV